MAQPTDLFSDKAQDWDSQPLPAQISHGVGQAIRQHVALGPEMTVMDFGAGTGLICARVAPHVKHVHAVDISPAMLDKLALKPELKGRSTIHCQDILSDPLPHRVDLVVSAMAMHHVEDTPALLRSLYDHLVPGGAVAIADLDTEDGTFHPPGIEGVFHAGFDRDALSAQLTEAGFSEPSFVTACDVSRDGKTYPIFLVTASRPS